MKTQIAAGIEIPPCTIAPLRDSDVVRGAVNVDFHSPSVKVLRDFKAKNKLPLEFGFGADGKAVTHRDWPT